jgi:nucleoside-diphosphate-sugar epimerase
MFMRIAITGASGVLGVRLTHHLCRIPDISVVGIDRRSTAASDDNLVLGDVRDERLLRLAFAGCDAVIHAAAALPSKRASEIRSVDVDGTTAVLAARRAAGVEQFVHISSAAVYGLPRVVPTREEHPRVGVDPYSQAKIEAELACEAARERGEHVTILRPKTFLGPGRLGIFAMLFDWAQDGRDFPLLGAGTQRIQMLDVDDLCDVVVRCLTGPQDLRNDTFNVGARRFGTLAEDFQAVLDEAGHGGRIRRLPILAGVPALRALAAVRLSPVYRRLLHKLLRDSYVSVDKASSVLGFDPKYSNVDTLLRTYRWWLNDPHARSTREGTTSGQPWRQGALRLARYAY